MFLDNFWTHTKEEQKRNGSLIMLKWKNRDRKREEKVRFLQISRTVIRLVHYSNLQKQQLFCI